MKNPLPINSPHHPVYAQRWRAQRNDIKGKWNCSKRWSKRHEPSSTNSRSLEYNCTSFILGHYARKSWGALRTMVLLVLQSCVISLSFYTFPFPSPAPIPFLQLSVWLYPSSENYYSNDKSKPVWRKIMKLLFSSNLLFFYSCESYHMILVLQNTTEQYHDSNRYFIKQLLQL